MRTRTVSGAGARVNLRPTDDLRQKNLRTMAQKGLHVSAGFLREVSGAGRIAQFFKIVDLDGILGGPATTVETLNRLFRRWYVLQTHSNPDPIGSRKEKWFRLTAKGPQVKPVPILDLGAWHYRQK